MTEHPLSTPASKNRPVAAFAFLFFLGTVLFAFSTGVGQEACMAVADARDPAESLAPEDPSDPAFQVYREGYMLILEEKWEAARKKLGEVTTRYPKSSYVDDAEYWIAYSYRESDRRKASRLYQIFLEKHPESSYYDDAVADLNQLQLQEALATLPQPPRAPNAHIEFLVQTRMPEELKRLEEQIEHMQSISRSDLKRRIVIPSFKGDSLMEIAMPMFRDFSGNGALDPQLRIRVSALRALSGARNDTKTFQTLREVAEDQHQPILLRQTAMESLAGFTKFDVGGVFIEIARKDTNEEMQTASVQYLAMSGRDKAKSLESLMTLFKSIPAHRTRQLGATLFAIADIGDDRATDFLAQVARAHQNINLRSDAVYYLGNIGSEKARTALQEILMGK